jgi:hypothetical protein
METAKKVEWHVKSVLRGDHAMIAIETTYHSDKRRTVSEINMPVEALKDVKSECKKLIDKVNEGERK